MGRFNTRLKVFPDGGHTYSFYDAGVMIGEKREKPIRDEERPPGDPRLIELKARKRARGEVYDLARSNLWDWFITLTLSPERVNRWDYSQCAAEVIRFTDVLRKAGNQYIIVPEQHLNGAWHFHGLVIGDLKLVPATNYHTGSFLFDSQGRQIFNIKNYKFGINTATAIGHSAKAASYIAKYMIKKMDIPKGKKRYWASKSLARPSVEYMDSSVYQQDFTEDNCDFLKKIDMKYGRLSICDFREDHYDHIAEFEEVSYDDHEDIFVQIDPAFTWKPLEGEQLEIEQNINCCPI